MGLLLLQLNFKRKGKRRGKFSQSNFNTYRKKKGDKLLYYRYPFFYFDLDPV